MTGQEAPEFGDQATTCERGNVILPGPQVYDAGIVHQMQPKYRDPRSEGEFDGDT